MSTEVGAIHISYYLDEEGELISGVSVEGDMPMVVVIGLLEMAKDTVLATSYEEDEND